MKNKCDLCERPIKKCGHLETVKYYAGNIKLPSKIQACKECRDKIKRVG